MSAADYFLKLEGIPGESTDSKHKGEIEVIAWSWGAQQSATMGYGGGGGAGKVSFHDMHISSKMNKSSPKLFLSCSNGEHIKTGILTCRKAGKEQQEFLVMKLNDVFITSFSTSAAGSGDPIPTDSMTISFSKIQIDYKDQKADGSLGGVVSANYSVKENKGS